MSDMRDLTNYEYQEQVDRMTDILKDAPGWGDGFDSSMGQRLIRLVADMTDNLHFMLERRSTERYITSARLRSSVLARATELGYRAKRVIGHYGTVMVTLDRPAENPINIPIFTTFTSDAGNVISSRSVTILEGQVEIEVPVKIGERITYEFEESEYSENNEAVIADYERIDNDTLIVKDENRTYDDVAFDSTGAPVRRAMTFLESTDSYYDIRYSHDGMRIVLGDGFFGRNPTGILTVEGIVVGDLTRSILTIGTEFSLSDLTDIEGFTYTTSVENNTQIRYGQEPEDTDIIRERAIEYHKTNGRAVTNSDFDFWMREANIAGIIDSKAFGERESNGIIHTMNNVYITYLKDTGEKMSVEQEQSVRNFLDELKMTTVHIVLNQARIMNLGVQVHVRKNPQLEIPNSEFYNIVRSFINSYFELKNGSIGREIQHSEVIRELHRLNYRQDNFEIPLIDYVRLDMDAMYPLEVPTNDKFVNLVIDDAYTPTTGDEFVLNLDNISCVVDINDSDTFLDIVERMRDEILDKTSLIAAIGFRDLVFDAFGDPLSVDIDNRNGVGFIVGLGTPYYSNQLVVDAATVGSAQVRLEITPDTIELRHTYYSMPSGRRPIIALREGTDISFTAPVDTDVLVYTRDDVKDDASEVLLTTVSAGSQFTDSFTERGAIQLEFMDDSQEDMEVEVLYSSFSDFGFALNITTRDSFGSFELRSNSGDIADFVNTEHRVMLPVKDTTEDNDLLIRPESLEIVNENNDLIYYSNEDGTLVDANNEQSVVGRIQWTSGALLVPNAIPEGNYFVRYQQNKYQNFTTGRDSAIQMLPISSDPESPNTFSYVEVDDD